MLEMTKRHNRRKAEVSKLQGPQEAGRGRRGAGLCLCARGRGPGRQPMGLSHLLLPQELLLRANLEEMRCAMPRARGEPPEQVRPAPRQPAPTAALPRQWQVAARWPLVWSKPWRPGSPCRWAAPLGLG